MIRMATLSDVPAIARLGELFFSESPHYAPLIYASEKIEGIAAGLIKDPSRGFVRVIDKGGGILGGMMGILGEHWAGYALVATEIVLFVEPSARGAVYADRLVAEFLEWGEKGGAVECVAGTSSGVRPELCARLYERRGFARNSIGFRHVYA